MGGRGNSNLERFYQPWGAPGRGGWVVVSGKQRAGQKSCDPFQVGCFFRIPKSIFPGVWNMITWAFGLHVECSPKYQPQWLHHPLPSIHKHSIWLVFSWSFFLFWNHFICFQIRKCFDFRSLQHLICIITIQLLRKKKEDNYLVHVPSSNLFWNEF